MKDKLLTDLLFGFIKIHILYHAGKEKIYGQEFRDELERHGYQVSFGTLYPIFHKLESEKYIKSTRVNVNGRLRRYYRITPKGKRILEKAIKQAKELVDELF